MKVQHRGLSILLSLVALLLVACQPGALSTAAITCLTNFEATVHHGPNAGLAVTGKLLFTLDPSGELVGGIVTADSTEIPVSGQANGRAINMSFTLGEQKFLFGVGSAENPINTCTGYWGGGFTGPEPGDSGDWLASDGRNIVDPNLEAVFEISSVSGLTITENSDATTFTLSLPGGSDGRYNFECKRQDGICQCKGMDDCVRLADTGICKDRIEFPLPNKEEGYCTYREPARN